MANTKVTGDLIASSTIATGNIADNAVTSDKISGITTAHITEGSNLYYTDARADARITAATTSDLTEGTNLYYTDARADARAALLVDSAPSTLDTLNELAAALGDDPNFATTTATSIGLKAPLASPSFTGNASFAGNVTLDNILLTTATLPAQNTPSISLRSSNNEIYFQAGSANVFNFMKADYTTMLALDGTTSATFAGNINFGDSHFIGDDASDNLLIQSSANENIIIDSLDETLFRINGSTKMQIKSSGNVGIGTASPVTKLHVSNTAVINDVYGLALVENTSTGTGSAANSALNIKSKYGTSQFMQWENQGLRIGSRILDNSSVGDVYFTAGADSVKMVVKAGGNVGIGRTAPDYKLVISNGNAEGIELGPGYASGNNLWQNYNRTTGAYVTETHYASTYAFLTAGGNTGNVGIGAAPGNYKLDVTGSGRFTGFFEMAGGGGVYQAQKFYLDGGGDTFLESPSSNLMTFTVGATERMRIDSSGNTNIKTGTLSIGQSSEQNISNTTGETWIGSNGLRYNSGSDTFARSSATAQAAMMVLTTTADVEFYTQASTSSTGTYALTPKMVIKGATSNVGIGITNPGAQLDIVGPSGGSAILKLQRNGVGAYQYFVTDIGSGAQQLFCDAQQADSGFVFRTRDSGNAAIAALYIAPSGNIGVFTTTPQTKLDVHGPTGTRNRNTQGSGSSVYETSLDWSANGNTTTNVSINTSTVFPPMGSSGFILVEVSASGYGNSGSNGLIFSYITGGYGGHYAAVNQPYHPVTITANTMMAGTCTWYNPSSGIIGITVAPTNSQGITGVMRVKVTTTY